MTIVRIWLQRDSEYCGDYKRRNIKMSIGFSTWKVTVIV